jgi:malate dehydrogenase (quinone)
MRNPRLSSSKDRSDVVDVVLIGGGIMSATLGALLTILQPNWSITLLERCDRVAQESSCPWNNAGTGHSGFCELNYMPDPQDATKAIEAARQFHLTRQWWAYLADTGLIPDPASFIRSTPHMNLVFGQHDVEYLRSRHTTLCGSPLFAGMEYTEDPALIAQWAPLLMDGRIPGEPVAATRYSQGTGVDYGALSNALTDILAEAGGIIRTGHEVRSLCRPRGGLWRVCGRTKGQRFKLLSRFVFVGAGGFALRLLQKARVPEVRGYGLLPVGAVFLRCDNQEVVARHDAKVYTQAPRGAYPMSGPHLDKRVVGDRASLMFGPYAILSARLLKHGKFFDVFMTLRWHNAPILAAAILQNLFHLRYLIAQRTGSRASKFAQLQRFYPSANPDDWNLVPAGQRIQLVTPDRRRVGLLGSGGELVIGEHGSIAGLLGALPGGSNALPIMINLLQQCFPHHWNTWKATLANAIPALAEPIDTREATAASLARTANSLGLRTPETQ